jgi:hypothetical protein
MNQASRNDSKDHERDRANIVLLRGLCDWIDARSVFDVISSCRYPSEAVKKTREAGLVDEANRIKRKAFTEIPPSAEWQNANRLADLKQRSEMAEQRKNG